MAEPRAVLSHLRLRRSVLLVFERALAYAEGVNFRANATFRAGDFSRLESLLVPKLMAGAQSGALAVLDISQQFVPVDTGRLVSSATTYVEWTGHMVTGYVQYGAYYAAYVEFGTGLRGAASPGAGPYEYADYWPGMRAQPYMRPALDLGRANVLEAFRDALEV